MNTKTLVKCVTWTMCVGLLTLGLCHKASGQGYTGNPDVNGVSPSAWATVFVQEPNAPDALTYLGFSAYMQGPVGVADANSLRPYLQLPWINPKDHPYHAKGDDSTDDANALNAAYAAAKAAGGPGVLLIPGGKYRFETTLVWDGGVDIIGAGKTFKTVLLPVGDINGVEITGNYGNTYERFDVNGVNQTGDRDGIVIAGASRSTFSDVRVYDCNREGISVYSPDPIATYNNNLMALINSGSIDNGRDGLRFWGAAASNNNAILLQNVDLRSNDANGLTNYNASDLVLNNVVAQANTGPGLAFRGSTHNCRGPVVYLENNASPELLFAAGSHGNAIDLSNDGAAYSDLDGTNTVFSASSGASDHYGYNRLTIDKFRIFDGSHTGSLMLSQTGDRAYSIQHYGASGTATTTLSKGTGTNHHLTVEGAITADGTIASGDALTMKDAGGTARTVVDITGANDDLVLSTGTTTGARTIIFKTESAERGHVANNGDLEWGSTVIPTSSAYSHATRTVLKTLDVDAASTDDYKFDNTQTNTTPQTVTLTGIVPAYAEVISWQIRCFETVNGTSMALKFGTTSGGTDVGSGSPDTANDIIGPTAGTAAMLTATNAARNLYVEATPGANWNTLTAGRWLIMVTYVDYGSAYTKRAP